MATGAMKAGAFLLALLAAALLVGANPAAAQHRSFARGIAGIAAPDSADQSTTYFDRPEVQALLARMEHGPVGAAEIDRLLQASPTHLADLLRLGLVRARGGGYGIGFSYFTLADMRLIHASAERHVPALVAAYLRWRPTFEAELRRYPVATVDRRVLAYALLAGVALNWDALTQLRRLGYRRPILREGPGWHYSFWAAEEDPAYSTHGFFWGSSSIFDRGRYNFPGRPVDFNFSSFGDPYSDPRMNLPDLLYLDEGDLQPDLRDIVRRLGFVDETFGGLNLHHVLGVSRARPLAAILFRLRAGPASRAELESLLDPAERPHAADFLALLTAIHYVRAQPGGFALTSVVLDRGDRALVERILAGHRRILRAWLRRHYPEIKAELRGLTALRQGLPFEALFTQIWHDYFGLATRQLVASGMIANPYAPGAPSPGSFGMTWRMSVYDLQLG